jgi:hypothetical protein
MHGQVAHRSRSVWANLDAIVLQEVDALRPTAAPRTAEPPFRSDEEFMDRATAYLGGRGEEAHRLVDHLRDMLSLPGSADADQSKVPQEPPGESPIDDVAPPEAEHE